jgi:hypothetical protein
MVVSPSRDRRFSICSGKDKAVTKAQWSGHLQRPVRHRTQLARVGCTEAEIASITGRGRATCARSSMPTASDHRPRLAIAKFACDMAFMG